jgi:drug/metabolite transporter (DMT)-like permease
MILAILTALAAAAAYGGGDFYGGVSAARIRVAPTSLVTYGLAGVTAAIALLFAGGSWTLAAVEWGALAGLFAIIGSLAFFAALVAGPMSLGAPIVGTIESAVPVIAAVLIGQVMTGLTWFAIALAVVGGGLVSLHIGSGERMTPRAGLFALVAGLAFGGSILALNHTPRDSGLIPAVFEGAVGFVVMAALLGAARLSPLLDRALRLFDTATDASAEPAPTARGRLSPGIRLWLPALVSGVLLGLGNALLVIALRLGELAVVTVLADLYPVATVLLAWFVVHERLSALQLIGIGAALAASALFAIA